MIDPQSRQVGLIYSIPGECDEYLTVLSVGENQLEVCGHLNLADLSDFDKSESEASWILQNGDLFRVLQWASSKKTGTSALKLCLDKDCYRPINFAKKESDLNDSSKSLIRTLCIEKSAEL